MRVEWIFALAVLLPATAPAQEIKQRPVRTEKITAASPATIGLYEIAPDGTVLIDWRAVETTASGPADRMAGPMARVMMAIRDGKWKPMDR
jgi:hypothetical protein